MGLILRLSTVLSNDSLSEITVNANQIKSKISLGARPGWMGRDVSQLAAG